MPFSSFSIELYLWVSLAFPNPFGPEPRHRDLIQTYHRPLKSFSLCSLHASFAGAAAMGSWGGLCYSFLFPLCYSVGASLLLLNFALPGRETPGLDEAGLLLIITVLIPAPSTTGL